MQLRLLVLLILCPPALCAQPAPARPAAPIPNAATLLHQVVAHQRRMDAIRENYTYLEHETLQKLNKHGHVRQTETFEYNVFFVHTHEIDELIRKNGHPLSPRQQRKQAKHIRHQIARAQSTPPGQPLNGRSVSVSELLAIMHLSRPRRTIIDGRPTLAFDFTGRRHAHAHGKVQRTLRKLTGTIWIDEKDREVRRLDAHFDANLHMGWGLVAVDKGSTFNFTQRPMRGQLWLPAGTRIHLVAHALGFFGYRANITITDSHYQVFHAGARQLPGVHVVPPTSQK